jgi:acylphosphatase
LPRIVRRLVVEGRVQGVGYRWSAVEEARRLGLAGWVRNRRDGTVEALVSGDEAGVIAFVEWTQIGPAGARVDRVTAENPGGPAGRAEQGELPFPFAQHPTA